MRPRLSRIYYRGDYFSYPLRAEDVVRRLGLVETVRCLGSYIAAKMRRSEPPETFEDWVTSRFGQRLYDAFFREYTEKVWGIPGNEIQAEWAAQRIRNLSFWTALTSALRIKRTPRDEPDRGVPLPAARPRTDVGGHRRPVGAGGCPGSARIFASTGCCTTQQGVHAIGVRGPTGEEELVDVDGVVSSIPLSELVLSLDPLPPDEVVAAARRLRYRDLLVVGLISSDPEPFPDNWIYLHDPGTRAGRVQNFGAWSPGMTRPGFTCLGAEYFCFQGDETWSLPDHALVELAKRELGQIGLIDPSSVVDGIAIRVPRAYPMYDRGYVDAVATLRAFLATIPNLQTVGRNGLHRYNNQDHSMWTAVLGTLNLLDGADHDVWAVNADAEYHEEGDLRDPLDQAPVIATVA